MKRRPDTVSLIAIYHFAMGIPFALASFALGLALAGVLLYVERHAAIPPAFGIGLALFLSAFFALAFVAVGVGLWQLWPWSRWGAIVLGVLVLPGFPIWTAIGALIIWYMFQDEAERAFRAK